MQRVHPAMIPVDSPLLQHGDGTTLHALLTTTSDDRRNGSDDDGNRDDYQLHQGWTAAPRQRVADGMAAAAVAEQLFLASRLRLQEGYKTRHPPLPLWGQLACHLDGSDAPPCTMAAERCGEYYIRTQERAVTVPGECMSAALTNLQSSTAA